MNDIRNKNSKEQYHGYQELYGYHKLMYRGNYKNNNMIHYSEYHFYETTRYHIR